MAKNLREGVCSTLHLLVRHAMKNFPRALLLILMVTPFFATAAFASERDACLNSCLGITGSQERYNACVAQCPFSGSRDGGGRVQTQTGRWTAIVFDRATGRAGTSWGYRDGQTARGVARNNCFGSGGRSCDWPMTQYDGCLAVAHGENQSGLVAHATARSRGGRAVATQKALAECRSGGGRSCRIVAAACSW